MNSGDGNIEVLEERRRELLARLKPTDYYGFEYELLNEEGSKCYTHGISYITNNAGLQSPYLKYYNCIEDNLFP